MGPAALRCGVLLAAAAAGAQAFAVGQPDFLGDNDDNGVEDRTDDDDCEACDNFNADDVEVALLVSLGLFGLALFTFECCRSVPEVYFPKLAAAPHLVPGQRAPPRAPLAWIPALFDGVDDSPSPPPSSPNTPLVTLAGVEGFMALRMLRLWVWVLAVGSLLGVLVLLPVFSTADASSSSGGEYYTLTASVADDNGRWWALTLVFYVVVCVALWGLHEEFKIYRDLKWKFLAGESMPPEMRNVVVIEYVPVRYANNSALKAIMDSIFPGQVLDAVVHVDCPALQDTLRVRNEILVLVERAALHLSVTGEQLEWNSSWGGAPPDGDTVAALTARLERLNDRVSDLQSLIAGREAALAAAYDEEGQSVELPPGAGAGDVQAYTQKDDDAFVAELDSPSQAVVAPPAPSGAGGERGSGGMKQSLLEGAAAEPDVRRLRLARGGEGGDAVEVLVSATAHVSFASRVPAAALKAGGAAGTGALLANGALQLYPVTCYGRSDTLWDNVTFSRSFSLRLGDCVAFVLVSVQASWGGVVTGVLWQTSGYDDDHVVVNEGPFGNRGDDNDDSPVLIDSGPGTVFVMALILYNLVPVLRGIATYILRMKSRASAEEFTLTWAFTFQMVNFVITVVAITVWNALDSAGTEFQSIMEALKEAVPSTSSAIMELLFVLLLGLSMTALLRPLQLGVYLFRCITRPAGTVTSREKRTGIMAAPKTTYATVYSLGLAGFAIGLAFVPLAPLMAPVVVVLLGVLYVIQRYLLLYVDDTRMDTGGLHFVQAHVLSVVACIVANLILVFYVCCTLYYDLWLVVCAGPVFIYFFVPTSNRQFFNANSVSLQLAQALDAKEGLEPLHGCDSVVPEQPARAVPEVQPEAVVGGGGCCGGVCFFRNGPHRGLTENKGAAPVPPPTEAGAVGGGPGGDGVGDGVVPPPTDGGAEV